MAHAEPWWLALLVVCWVSVSVLATCLWCWLRQGCTAGHWSDPHADPHGDPHGDPHAPPTVPTQGSTAGVDRVPE